MQLKVVAFAQARDQLGFDEIVVDCDDQETPRAVIHRLQPEFFPGSMRVALDHQYTDWDAPVGNARELALIPPVSGG
jgi:molybdopterin synthase sulfur carrier subunit